MLEFKAVRTPAGTSADKHPDRYPGGHLSDETHQNFLSRRASALGLLCLSFADPDFDGFKSLIRGWTAFRNSAGHVDWARLVTACIDGHENEMVIVFILDFSSHLCVQINITATPADGGNKAAKLRAIREALRTARRVWLATDCDREGQLIGQEILEHYEYRGQVMRVLFTAQDLQTWNFKQPFDFHSFV